VAKKAKATKKQKEQQMTQGQSAGKMDMELAQEFEQKKGKEKK